MAKEKRMREVEEKNYFKELLAFFTAIVMLIFLGSLGTLGHYGSLIAKIIFGEYSFLILGLILFSMLKLIVKGTGLNFSSLSFQGFIFLFLAISMLSHLTIYNELGLTTKSIFSKTISLYKGYFSSYQSSYYVGGGILGLIMFQITILLLGKIGVIIIGIALIIMGLSYLLNNSVWDFIKKYRKIFRFGGKITGKIKYFVKRLSIPKEKEHKARPRPNISLLNDVRTSSNIILQQELVKEYEFKIKNELELPNFKYTQSILNTNFTCYIFEQINQNEKERITISQLFNHECIFLSQNNYLLVDMPNRFKELLTLKKVLLEYENEIPFGINSFNDLIAFNIREFKPFLLAGAAGSGIKTFIRSFISSLIINHSGSFKIRMLDARRELRELKGLENKIIYAESVGDINKQIEELIFEYDKRYELLKYLEVNDYLDGNELILERFKQLDLVEPTYIFINTGMNFLPSATIDKINYLLASGRRVGFYIFLIIRENEMFNLNISQFNKLIFKLKDLSLSLKLLGADKACFLSYKGDFLYIENEKISHAQAPYCSMTDYLRLLEKFTS